MKLSALFIGIALAGLSMASHCPEVGAGFEEDSGIVPGAGPTGLQPWDASTPEWIRKRLTGFGYLQLGAHPAVLNFNHSAEIELPDADFNLDQLIEFLSKHSNMVKYLDLSGRKLGDVGVAHLAPHFPQGLTGLGLSGCEITDTGLQALAEKFPPYLRSLVLVQNKFGALGAKMLSEHLPKRLTLLNLNNNDIGDQGVEALAREMPKTTAELFFANNKITNVGLEALVKHLPAPRILTVLWLYGNDIGDKGARLMVQSHAKLAALKQLNLADNKISIAKIEALEAAYGRIVYVGVPKWIEERLKPIEGVEGRYTLSAHLDGDYSHGGEETLAGLIWFLKRDGKDIENLYLSDANESDAIAIAPYLPPRLKTLEFSVSKIGDRGVAALAPHLPSTLTKLWLGGNNIGERGMVALAAHLPAGLEILDVNAILNGVEIGDVGARALAAHMPPNLQILSLANGGIGPAASLEIINKLPSSLQDFTFHGNATNSACLIRLKERCGELSAIQSISLTKTSDHGSNYYKNIIDLQTIYGKTKKGKEIVHW